MFLGLWLWWGKGIILVTQLRMVIWSTSKWVVLSFKLWGFNAIKALSYSLTSKYSIRPRLTKFLNSNSALLTLRFSMSSCLSWDTPFFTMINGLTNLPLSDETLRDLLLVSIAIETNSFIFPLLRNNFISSVSLWGYRCRPTMLPLRKTK